MVNKDFEDIEPDEFYELAQELHEIKNNLNSSNSAINRNIYMRIYYSVFLFLREWLKKHTDYHSWPKREHYRLAKNIKFHGPFNDEINEEICLELNILKQLRHQADYKLNVPNKFSPDYQKWNFTDIQTAFEIAKDIINPFKEFKN